MDLAKRASLTSGPAIAGPAESSAAGAAADHPTAPSKAPESCPKSEIAALTAGDRLQRIGSILYRAACRLDASSPAGTPAARAILTPLQQKILAVIRGLDSATPEQIRSAAQGSRAHLARHLRVLLAQGLVVRTGLTRQTRYSLPAKQRNVIQFEHDSPSRTLEFPVPPATEAANAAPGQTSDALALDLG